MDTRIFRSGTLDMAYPDTLLKTQVDLAQRFNVAVEIVNPRSSAGGWPEVALVGRLADVARCIREQWVSGDEEQDFEVLNEALGAGTWL